MHTHTLVRWSVSFIDCYEDRLYISIRKSQQRISKRISCQTDTVIIIGGFLHFTKEEALVRMSKRLQITFVFPSFFSGEISFILFTSEMEEISWGD